MSSLSQLQELNPHIEILPISDPSFAHYARIIDVRAEKALQWARENRVYPEGFVCSVSVPDFEANLDLMQSISNDVYGGMDIQMGWVFGQNDILNGLEYHHGPEVHLMLEDTVFLVAHIQDIEWAPKPMLDTKAVRAYFAPKGSAVVLPAWCLHFVPINASKKDGFCNIITLLRGTGSALTFEKPESQEGALLVGKNQWLMVHPEAKEMVDSGNVVGLSGENIRINQID